MTTFGELKIGAQYVLAHNVRAGVFTKTAEPSTAGVNGRKVHRIQDGVFVERDPATTERRKTKRRETAGGGHGLRVRRGGYRSGDFQRPEPVQPEVSA